jgi:hypothetical protein
MGLHGLLQSSFTFLYVDDVRTSQETYIWVSMASYGDILTFYMFVPHRRHIYGPP